MVRNFSSCEGLGISNKGKLFTTWSREVALRRAPREMISSMNRMAASRAGPLSFCLGTKLWVGGWMKLIDAPSLNSVQCISGHSYHSTARWAGPVFPQFSLWWESSSRPCWIRQAWFFPTLRAALWGMNTCCRWKVLPKEMSGRVHVVSEVEEGRRRWTEDTEKDGDGDGRRDLGESKKRVITVPNCIHTCCLMLEERRAMDQESKPLSSVPLSFWSSLTWIRWIPLDGIKI